MALLALSPTSSKTSHPRTMLSLIFLNPEGLHVPPMKNNNNNNNNNSIIKIIIIMILLLLYYYYFISIEARGTLLLNC